MKPYPWCQLTGKEGVIEHRKRERPCSFSFSLFFFYTYSNRHTPYTYAHTTFKAMLGTYGWIFLTGVIVFFLVIVLLLCFTRSPIALSENVGNADFDEWLIEPEDEVATLPEDARLSYERAKGKSYEEGMVYGYLYDCCIVFQERHPPDSIPTDLTPPQLISIQEKGVSAFEFEWEPDANCFVAGRTEVQFMYGESCVQTNLPLPRNQDVYYWEVCNNKSDVVYIYIHKRD